MKNITSRSVSPGLRAGLWGVGLLLALSLFMGAQDLPLRDFREARFAEVGWEMLQTGDWVIPHLNNSPYLNKPPMVGWLVALSMKLLGKSETAARLPNFLAMLGIALCVGWLLHMTAGPPWAVLGVTLYLGSPAAQYYGRMLSSDVVALFFMTGALVAFCKAFLETSKPFYLVGFGFCALALLAKGLAGALYPLGAMLFFLILLRRNKLGEVPWLAGLVVFLGISLPWFLMAESREPGFLWHHFLEQQVMRVASGGGGGPFVALPRWEILLGFAGLLGPVTLLLPWTLGLGSGKGNVLGLLWIYAFLVLGSVFLSAGRNQTYTLPATVPMVALVGLRLAQPGRILPAWGPSLLLGALSAASVAGVFITGEILERIWKGLARQDLVSRVQICMAMVAVLVGVSAFWMGKGRTRVGAAFIGAVMLPGGWMLSLLQGAMAPLESRRDLAVWVSETLPKEWPLVVADPSDAQFEGTAGWNFYAGRQVFMIRFQELSQIKAQAPRLPQWIISKEEFMEMLASGKPLALAATPKGIQLLEIPGLPAPSAADWKFQLWVLNSGEGGREPPAAPSQTGRISSSSTFFQEG
jgi:4-amino-4-deoxy-L-arabinose transferase-like glycosyltransferase